MSVCAHRPERTEPEPTEASCRDDVRYTVQEKAKLDVSSRSRILDLLRPGDPATESIEDIVRPLPRRGLIRPYDEDTRRFLQRVLLTSTTISSPFDTRLDSDYDQSFENDATGECQDLKKERSLADELREAEEEEKSGSLRRDLLREFRKRGGGVREAIERDRLGKLALSVEQDEEAEDSELSAAARRLDALLAESRSLHRELAGIHEDIQVLARRVAQRHT